MRRRPRRLALLAVLPALVAGAEPATPGGAEPALAMQVVRAEEHAARVEPHRGGQRGGRALWLVLDAPSRAAFAGWTRRNAGQRVQLRVDGELLVEARLGGPIADGMIVLHTGTDRFGAIQTVLSHAKGRLSAVAVP